ncbi:MAG: SpoIVB peptidase S55 domain-containing protein, partial [Acidobacteriota bacterium]
AVMLALSTGAAAVAVELLPVAELQPGMVGEGQTVFSGERVDRFKVTILGVLHNFGPKQDMILARLEGGPLAETGVAAGMSGSPVYVDGKLIGAIAYSFPFSKEPIAGITPIQEMIEATATPAPRRRVAKLDFPRFQWTREWNPERLLSSATGRGRPVAIQGSSPTGSGLLRPYLGRLLSPIATPASFHGFLPEAFDAVAPLLRRLGLEPLLGGTVAPIASVSLPVSGLPGVPAHQEAMATGVPTAEPPLQPGDAIGVGLITGDLDLSATGTVTYVDASTNSVYAFGHPLFNLGPIEYPMKRARVHLVLPNLLTSFKLSSTGLTVGTWVQDRNTGIKGVLETRPRMIPLSVTVKTSRGQEKGYQVKVVTDELFSPVLVYASLLSILQATERQFGGQTVKLTARISMANERPILIEDIFADEQPALAASAMVAAPLAFLMTNDFRAIKVEGVQATIEASESLKTAELVRAWLDSSQVTPGGSVALKLLLRSYRGEETLEEVDVSIPSNVNEGKLTLLVADAQTISALEKRQAKSSFVPRSFHQLVRALNNLRKNNRLYVRLTRPDQGGAILAGEYLSSLPPSVLSILETDKSSASYVPIQNSTVWEYELATDFSVRGSRVLEIEVKNR